MSAIAEHEPMAVLPAEERTDFYRFFAYALASPNRDRYRALHSRNFAAALRQLWQRLECEGQFPALGRFRNYQQYESAYIALFDVGSPEPPVPLVESGHYKSVPAQQIALENVSFYEVLGLKVDAGRTFPDHLLTQLEFLAAVRFTREQTAHDADRAGLRQLEKDFLTRHLLNWLPNAQAKLMKLGPPIFATVITLLVRFLQHRLRFEL